MTLFYSKLFWKKFWKNPPILCPSWLSHPVVWPTILEVHIEFIWCAVTLSLTIQGNNINCVCVCVYVCMYVFVCVVYVCVCVCMYVCVCVCVYVCVISGLNECANSSECWNVKKQNKTKPKKTNNRGYKIRRVYCGGVACVRTRFAWQWCSVCLSIWFYELYLLICVFTGKELEFTIDPSSLENLKDRKAVPDFAVKVHTTVHRITHTHTER